MNYKYYIKKISQPAADAVVLDLADSSGAPVFDFKSGQYVMISYADEKGRLKDKHAFSLASSPAEKGFIRLGIRVGGPFTQGLTKLKEGDLVFVNGPFGNFVFDEKKYPDLVLLAGGIGITPFMSTIRYVNDQKLPNKITLLYSSRSFAGTLFYDEIEWLKNGNSNIRALYSVTDGNILTGHKDIIGETLNQKIINDFVGSVKDKTFFICGPLPFMRAMKSNLLDLGARETQIKMEGFSMIADDSYLVKTRNFSYAMSVAVSLLILFYYLISNAAKGENAKKINGDSGGKVLDVRGNILSATSSGVAPSPSTRTSGVVDQAPAPVTSASGAAVTSQFVAPVSVPAAKQVQPVIKAASPKPITSSSVPASSMSAPAAPVIKQAPPVQNNIAPTPAPVTSASVPQREWEEEDD